MKCIISKYSCVYHACLSDECQQIPVFENGVSFGLGECQQFNADNSAREIIARLCGNPPEKAKLEYTLWLNRQKLEFYSKNAKTHDSFAGKMLESYNSLVRISTEMLKNIETSIQP